MPTALRRLADGTWIEVDHADTAVEVSGGLPKRLDKSLDQVRTVLSQIKEPILGAIKDLSESVTLEEVEVEVALGIEGEGNVYIAKLKGSANFTVRFKIKPDAASSN